MKVKKRKDKLDIHDKRSKMTLITLSIYFSNYLPPKYYLGLKSDID